jgi:HK97 family phage prohead protease
MSITMPATGPELRRALVASIDNLEIRESGSGDGSLHLQGHAAVFDRLSHDLGGFREKIARGAFADALDADPDVHLVHGHDMTSAMASTRAKTLELREDPAGLRVWAQLDPEDPDVRRLIPKMRRGDVRQMSFAFSMLGGDDRWEVENAETADERVVRTIVRVGSLHDVSVVAQGAYPQTDASLRSVLDAAIESGRVPLLARATPEDAAAPEPDASPEPSHSVGGTHRARVLARIRAHAAALNIPNKENEQ